MRGMDVSPRQVVLIGLAAIVPGVIFAVGTGEYIVAIAIVNVVLIVASLVYAMSDTETESEPPDASAANGGPAGQ